MHKHNKLNLFSVVFVLDEIHTKLNACPVKYRENVFLAFNINNVHLESISGTFQS